jgi:ATP-binding cassette subfamily B protein
MLPRTLLGALRLTWQASRRGFVVAAALQIVAALSTAALVIIGQRALDALLALGSAGSRGIDGLVVIMILLAAATAVGSTTASLQQQQQRLLGEQVAVAAWRRVLDVTGRVELEMYETPQFYDQLQRVRANVAVRPAAVTTAVFGLIGSTVATVGLLVVLLAIDPLLAPVLLLAGVPAVLLTRRSGRLEFRFVAAASPIYRAREYLRGVLTGRDEAKEVRAFGMESALRRRHDERSATFLESLRRHVRVRQLYGLGVVLATTVALAVALAVLVWFLSAGRIGVADAGAAALGIRLLSLRLDQIFSSVGGLLESSVFLDDVDGFLRLGASETTGCTGIGPKLRQAVTLDRVSYTYPGSERPAVRGVSLDIRRGEVIGIVGENGSGKTTLAKIIAGLYGPTSGRIAWDGVDAAGFHPADLRRGVAVIFQDFVRYQLTARENIGLGDPDHVDDLDAARHAAHRAGAAGFLESLPAGYDTILSKEYAGGTDLSVGQWQRVALARALRRDAPLVILDEPSSALDPRAEQALFADVRAMLDGRCAVLVSHRYSTVRTADRIFVMSDGQVVEAGSHDALMATDGIYKELFTMQAQAYR